MIAAAWAGADRMTEAFTTGEGVSWSEHEARLFSGTEGFFGPQYRAHLVAEWIPALDGVEEKLAAGGRVADVGCGYGTSTILMADAFPRSTVVGIDPHPESVQAARKAAAEAGVAERAKFEIADATGYGKDGAYDLVCFFDALHDMGDPVGAARYARDTLNPGGVVLLVEPNAADRAEDNINPIGRLGYALSTLFCVPNSRSQPVALGLGAQAGEARLREVMVEAGFSSFRRAAETPINLVLEARA